MQNGLDNPFTDYGGIVSGERFIGRSADLRTVESRIIHTPVPGNLAIVGDSRVGKSSLVYHAIMEPKKRLLKDKQIPIWINLGTCDTRSHFFRLLVTECFEELEELGWLTESIESAMNRVLQNDHSWTTEYRSIQRFFRIVKQAGYRILFILDEFDNARYLFHEDVNGFQGLRELSYNPQWRITFITTSRRTVYDIELQTRGMSTLAGIFQTMYLGMFSDQDRQEFYQRLASVGIPITEEVRSKFSSYCGGHPYLLDVLGYRVVEQDKECNDFDLDEAAQRVEHEFIGHYDQMATRLGEDESFNQLLQILFGPVVDVKQGDVDELLRYGFIRESSDGNYKTFSEHFQAYLRLREREVDLWPIWKETEIALRSAVNAYMTEQYGEDWIRVLERSRPNLNSIFKKCRELQKKEEKSMGGRASRSLLDFTYPQELFNIILVEWNVFKAVFKQDKPYWNYRGQLLSKVRTPLAHNRDQSLYEHDRQIAEGYCKEILTILKT